jgi:hypothetical protein
MEREPQRKASSFQRQVQSYCWSETCKDPEQDEPGWKGGKESTLLWPVPASPYFLTSVTWWEWGSASKVQVKSKKLSYKSLGGAGSSVWSKEREASI